MPEPKVSIIVPVYNVEKYIGRCIESIQNQTLKEWELILIDDCSPDKSYDIIESYARDDSRIRILRHDKNHGPMMARHLGDQNATGEYITYCDGDDMLPPNALYDLLEAALQSDADIVSGNYVYVKLDNTKITKKYSMNYGNDVHGCLKAIFKGELSHILCSKLFKASILKENDYIIVDRMTNGEDLYMFYQILKHIKKMIHIPKNVYFYIQNPTSSTQIRLSENALDNHGFTNHLTTQIINEYSDLRRDIVAKVSNNLIDLQYMGYNRDGSLSKVCTKYNLQYYMSNKAIFSSHTFLQALKLWCKKFISSL